jgi:hypothetical protein
MSARPNERTLPDERLRPQALTNAVWVGVIGEGRQAAETHRPS